MSMVTKMVDISPIDRPSAKTLLSSNLYLDKDQVRAFTTHSPSLLCTIIITLFTNIKSRSKILLRMGLFSLYLADQILFNKQQVFFSRYFVYNFNGFSIFTDNFTFRNSNRRTRDE